jgi:capsular exopolysaccharide synthesis family protein
MSQENLVEFEDYVAAIGRRRKLIVVVVAVFVVLGAAFSVLSTKTYTSESRVSVTPIFDPGTGTSGEVNVDTEIGIAQSSAVATIAQRTLRSQASPSELLDRVSVNAVGDSTIIAVRYTHADPDAAFRGANAFAEAYLEFRASQADAATRQARQLLEDEKSTNEDELNRLETQLGGLTAGTPDFADVNGRIQALNGAQTSLERQIQQLSSDAVDPGTIIDEAEIPTSPSSPGLLLNVAGGALIGLVLALTATFVLERKNLGTRGEPAAAPVDPGPPAPALAAASPIPAIAPSPAAAPLPARSTPTGNPTPPPVEATLPTAEPAPAPRTARPARTVAALPAAPVDRSPAPTPAAPAAPAPSATAADRRVRRDATQALAGLQVELLGNVPRLSNDAGEPAFDAVALGGPAGEALRRLHATLRPRLDAQGARVIFVTSAIERGVTVGLAGGLAATAALAGQDALLIAGDLHHPRLHDRLELGNDQGLAEVLNGTRPMNQVLQGWSGIETLCVVTAGRPGPDPSSLVSADRLAAQLATIRNEFQLIVIEGPPIGETPDATVMASVSDAVILAVDPRHSAENELGGAVSRLRLAKAPLLGAVVVEARSPRTGIPAVPAGAVPSRG